MNAAGVPYVVDGPDGPLYADFHALRHSFIALLDRSGATLKEAMQLARHNDPRLTLAVYGRAQLHDLGQAVERLPGLLTGPGSGQETAQATGTDGNCLRSVCAPPVPSGPQLAMGGDEQGTTPGKANRPQHDEKAMVAGGSPRLSAVGEIPPARFERATRCLEGSCSVQLSYGGLSGLSHVCCILQGDPPAVNRSTHDCGGGFARACNGGAACDNEPLPRPSLEKPQ